MDFLKEASDQVIERILREEDIIKSNTQNEQIPMRFRVLLSHLDTDVKVAALKKVDALMASEEEGAGSTSHQKLLNYVDALVSLPIGSYVSLPVSKNSPQEEIADFINRMSKSLDEAVFGHAKAKGHIMRLLAQWILNPTAKGLVIGLHGPPGVGKTALCKAVCKCLGLPFAFVPLGGANDSSVLDGHSFTYEGSTWGKISDVLMKAKCMNPVLYFDELDKISETKADVANMLIHLTDPTQNEHFGDKYFLGVNLDLSRCLVIFSYNDESIVHPVLRDRIVSIRTDPYSATEKAHIAKQHLLPDILEEFGMARDQIGIEDVALKRLIAIHASEEGGVRSIKRAIHEIVSHINYARATNPSATGLPELITVKDVESLAPNQTIPNHILMSMYS